MMHLEQFRLEVIEPTLNYLDMHSLPAEQLLLGTMVQESSGGFYLRQHPSGPALGVYQLERRTHADIWRHFISHRGQLSHKMMNLLAPWPDRADQLKTNLAYATAMARIHYRRDPRPLPDAGDAQAMGDYWKRVYNTHHGKGTADAFVRGFNEYVAPLYS